MEGYNEQNILFLKKWILSNDDNMWNKILSYVFHIVLIANF